MDRQTLSDWVHRFNAAGPGGPVNRKAPGAERRLTAAQLGIMGTVYLIRPRQRPAAELELSILSPKFCPQNS
jgi:hypothetical protein